MITALWQLRALLVHRPTDVAMAVLRGYTTVNSFVF
jgi:hypothetical protein